MSIIVNRIVKTGIDTEYINTDNIIRMWKSEVTTTYWRKPDTTIYYLWFKFVDGSKWGWSYTNIEKRNEAFLKCGEIMIAKEEIVVDLGKGK